MYADVEYVTNTKKQTDFNKIIIIGFQKQLLYISM